MQASRTPTDLSLATPCTAFPNCHPPDTSAKCDSVMENQQAAIWYPYLYVYWYSAAPFKVAGSKAIPTIASPRLVLTSTSFLASL